MMLTPSSRLGPYEILALLGAGSMGEVYRARDTRLGREVAVKVLPAALAADPERFRRFEQEAQAAGALDHPNVVIIHDVGAHDGLPFVVSELIDGRTVRDALAAGPLPPRRAVGYAAQIARGLAAAHDHGVVHRDLKPENIMVLSDGRVKIVDFGVARLDASVAASDGGLSATRLPQTLPGILLGTVAYMSPEQARGEAVDHRSDIFSLGVLLYEMVAGSRPFEGGSAAEVLGAILRDDPPPLTGVSPDLDKIVRRCLEKRREARFQSARDLAFALDALDSDIGQAAANRTTPQVPDDTARAGAWDRTIAVLPFDNVGGEPENGYFSDGLTEDLIHALTRVPGLRVVAWGSAAKMRGREADLRAIGQQLRVGTVLMGAVRKANDQVRVTARLVDTASGYYLWSESYDRRVEDVFALQDEIARTIAEMLTRRLVQHAPAGGGRRAESPDAYALYLKGRFFWNKRTNEGLLKSVEYFDQAIAADPGLAVAHSGRADAYCLLADYAVLHPRDVMPHARAAARAALDLDPRSAEAHVSYALIRSTYDWEWDEAEAFYRRALELNPGYATAHHWFAVDYLAARGRFDEARREIELARELDPLSLIILESRVYLFTLERRFDRATDGYRELIEFDPTFYKAYTSLARVYSLRGMHDEALEMMRKGHALAGDSPSVLGALGQISAVGGRHAEARAVLGELTRLAAERYVPSTAFALVHTGLGEVTQALDWLEKGCDQHELPMTALKVHPIYDRLRADPRFSRLLARMRLDG
jgi:TolB-like protein/Tfp pilus assembly protein PilF